MGIVDEDNVKRLQWQMVYAIATGAELKWVSHFITPATLQDLAKMERAFVRWFRSTCRVYFKLKPHQIPTIRLDLATAQHSDDGDNRVTITVDMGKIFPGTRPPELLKLADEMMTRLEEANGQG